VEGRFVDMSIISCVYVPEGIVLTGDSRITHTADRGNGIKEVYSLSDNNQKVFLLSKKRVGIATCGSAFINNSSIADFLRKFEIEQLTGSESIEEIANRLMNSLKENNADGVILFLVGYKNNDTQYFAEITSATVIHKNIPHENGNPNYGISWKGETLAISKLLVLDPQTYIWFDVMPLKDAVDLAEFLIDLTIKYERFKDGVATCGGPIDILVVTKDYGKFLKHKVLGSVI